MSDPLIFNGLIKKSSIHGYGVFAVRDIFPDEMIEETRVIFMDHKITDLIDYIFLAENKYALPLGAGAIYNHSDSPNAVCKIDVAQSSMVFRAIDKIKQGDEIFIYYGPTWFDVRRCKVTQSTLLYRLKSFIVKSGFALRFSFVLAAIAVFLRVLH